MTETIRVVARHAVSRYCQHFVRVEQNKVIFPIVQRMQIFLSTRYIHKIARVINFYATSSNATRKLYARCSACRFYYKLHTSKKY